MATNASKVNGMAVQKKKNGKCEIKIGRATIKGTPKLAEYVAQGRMIKRQMDAMREKLAALNNEIAAAVRTKMDGMGTAHVLVDDIDCKVVFKDKVVIADAMKLAEVLGPRFNDLVKVKESFNPEQRLIDIAVDADDPVSKGVQACLEIKEANPSVSYISK
jgi:hypothetical protein